MFCCTLLYVHSSIAIILMGKRKLIALLNLSSWCLVMVERLFLAVPQGCLQFVIVVFPDHTHLLFFGPVCGIGTGCESFIYNAMCIDFERFILVFPLSIGIQTRKATSSYIYDLLSDIKFKDLLHF